MYGRHATTIIGYTADADMWCRECAALVYDRRVDGVLRTVGGTDLSRDGFDAVDFEGNPVRPVFVSDETDPDAACNRCGQEIDY